MGIIYTNLSDPNKSSDSVNKSYVDSKTQKLPVPVLSGTNTMNDNSTNAYTITNYDSTCTYIVEFSDEYLVEGKVEGNTITIYAGDITNGADHTVTMTVFVYKDGYLESFTNEDVTIKDFSIVSDTALIWWGATYTSSTLDIVYSGALV